MQVMSFSLDRGFPVGNSKGDDLRWRAHTKVANSPSEPIPVVQTPITASNATLTQPASSTDSEVIANANANRLGMIGIVNNATARLGTAYLAYGPVASLSAYTWRLTPGSSWTMDVLYTGVISVIWDVQDGSQLQLTELLS